MNIQWLKEEIKNFDRDTLINLVQSYPVSYDKKEQWVKNYKWDKWSLHTSKTKELRQFIYEQKAIKHFKNFQAKIKPVNDINKISPSGELEEFEADKYRCIIPDALVDDIYLVPGRNSQECIIMNRGFGCWFRTTSESALKRLEYLTLRNKLDNESQVDKREIKRLR